MSLSALKVNLILLTRHPMDETFDGQKASGEKRVLEYRIYIHDRQGYINTFMLGPGGQPHAIIPGYDGQTRAMKSQLLHYLIK